MKKIISSSMPTGINYISGVSSQLKSLQLLAAGLNAYGETIKEIKILKARNHTENLLSNKKSVIEN